MENCNYLIIININCGENFPLNESSVEFGEEWEACVVLEARFNEDVISSDSIPITSADPQLRTELGFQVNRRQLHLFRIERKPIKLQCFVQYSNGYNERHFIGYTVLDLRNAQNYSNEPKFEWKTLLNPKYKGVSHRRPQVLMALMLNKMEENESNDNQMNTRDEEWQQLTDAEHIERPQNSFDPNLESNYKHLGQSDSQEDSHIENDIKVRLKNGFYNIWDERHSSESDCKLKFSLSITIAFAENIRQLISSLQLIENCKPFHFRYTFLGTIVKTDPFIDIDSCNFQIERTTFKILTTDRNTLSVYFELHPTIEVQLCDKCDTLYGFVAISLSQFADITQSIYRPIEGSFVLLPNDESIEISEPFPIVGISIELKEQIIETISNPNSSSPKDQIENRNGTKPLDSTPLQTKKMENKEPNASKLNHYCFAIDLRSIRVIDSDLPPIDCCYLQFSYAFFGFSESIKTFPSVKLKANTDVTIPHGFCAFNFATTQETLEKTFTEIPLVLEVIEETKIKTLIGTANVQLLKVLQVDTKQVVNLKVPVINEENRQLAQIQIIMYLQNFGTTQIPQMSNSPEVSVLKPIPINNNNNVSLQSIKNLDDLVMETALEIELWKEKQLILFREQLKQNESQYFKQLEEKQTQREEEVKYKISELTALENKLLKSLKDLNVRENELKLKENEIDEKHREVNVRFQRLNSEISEAISDIKEHYEQRMTSERNKLKEVELERGKYQERVYFLERKLKEKDITIKELEEQISESNKKFYSNGKVLPKEQKISTVKTLTRSINTTPKKVVITRDTQMSSRPNNNEVHKTKESIFSKSSPSKTSIKPMTNGFKNSPTKMINKRPIFNEEKSLLIRKIRSERNELIKNGIAPNDPLIVEINKKLMDI